MKRIAPTLLSLLIMTVAVAQNHLNTVNAIIGDISYVQQFGQVPNENSNENLRLQTHLSYVEEVLKQKDLSQLSAQQKANRELILQLLHQYRANGVFPKNYDFKDRRPCFIDQDGNICAVGYLIEQTAGREVAEDINARHQYDYLLDMNEEVIAQWAEKHGLTLEECAMIQPAYGWIPSPGEPVVAPIDREYGIASGIAIGVNAGMTILNISSRFKSANKNLPYIGLATGATQLVMGLVSIQEDETQYAIVGSARTISYKSQNNLSYVNIAVGTTTVLTSVFNLLLNNKLKDSRNAVSLYSYPDVNNKLTAGLSFRRNL
jgi:hypothetical protein